MIDPSEEQDLSADYARQRAEVEASLGRVFLHSSQLASYWDGRPVEALLRRAPVRWGAAQHADPVFVHTAPRNLARTSKEELLRNFLDFARRRPVVASVLAVTAGAVALYAMKLASEQE